MSDLRKRALVGAGVVLVALLGLGAGYAIRGGGDDADAVRAEGPSPSTTEAQADSPEDTAADEPVLPALPPVATDGLAGPALDLANAINLAAGLSYHAVYEGDHTGPSGVTSRATVEVWHQPPVARRDTTIAAPDGTLRTRELRLERRLIGCVDTNKGDTEPNWICVPSAGKGVDPAEPLLGTARPAAGTVAVRDDVIGGIASRCFTVTATGGTVQEVCFDADGIPVSIDGGDSRLVRTEVGRGVDPDTVSIPEGATMRSSAEPA